MLGGVLGYGMERLHVPFRFEIELVPIDNSIAFKHEL
ncbi:hypothetical protein PS639_03993 [Pseudomonas fluorescens]|nr:hypothetical protein PS639_03993 [Pseudomonas fluorescens]